MQVVVVELVIAVQEMVQKVSADWVAVDPVTNQLRHLLGMEPMV